jgi:hypothetical protein
VETTQEVALGVAVAMRNSNEEVVEEAVMHLESVVGLSNTIPKGRRHQ